MPVQNVCGAVALPRHLQQQQQAKQQRIVVFLIESTLTQQCACPFFGRVALPRRVDGVAGYVQMQLAHGHARQVISAHRQAAGQQRGACRVPERARVRHSKQSEIAREVSETNN